MAFKIGVVGLVGVGAAAFVASTAFGQDDPSSDAGAAGFAPPQHQTVLWNYCTECHDPIENKAGLDLFALDANRPEDAPERWEAVVRKIRAGMMPPTGEPRPPRDVLDATATAIEDRLDAAEAGAPHPNTPLLHRLNRTEYANAIRDLLALDVDVTTLLPADDTAEGFDNMAEVLVVSPSLVESYVSAAMKISRRAIGDMTMLPARSTYKAPDGLDQDEHVEGLPLGTRGGFVVHHDFPLDADYEFRIDAGQVFGFGSRAVLEDPPEVVLTFDGKPAPAEDPTHFTTHMPAGPVEIGVSLLDKSRPRGSTGGVEGFYSGRPRPEIVTSMVIIGPTNADGPGDSPSRKKIFSCHPDAGADAEPCARQVFARLATSAFRRPVAADGEEVDELMAYYEEGAANGGFEAGVQRGLAQVLVDPRFLFRIESPPDGVPAGATYRISDLELASELSFFLWSSIPDDDLIETASAGRLSDPDVLRAEINRMLADPRAHALVDNFAGQWLRLRELDDVAPDTPNWDENLRQSLGGETERLFESVMSDDSSVVDLLDADYTFLDERLARHYGVPGVHGSYFRRVSLPEGSPRRGILGQGSILTVTSVANRTSPVVRGAWVLENLLGAPPPAPPPGVETDLDRKEVSAAATLRERLEIHRADPVCASCHNVMDPVGLSLENFDLIGGWRQIDGGQPIDATGELVDGTQIDGVNDLRQSLMSRSDLFVTVFVQKLMTYALGRGVDYVDMPAVRSVVRGAQADDYRFASLVYGIATSTPFQMRVKADDAADGASETLADANGD